MNLFEERYQKLNDEQRLAVDTIDGPVLVVAGPGSGKTELLGLRVANLMKETDCNPSSILCLTFTESAAVNMKKRLASIIGKEAYHVSVHTFHSFGTEIINYFPEYFFHGAEFTAADDVTQREILEEIFDKVGFDNPLKSMHSEQGYTYLKATLQRISDLKKAGLAPDEFEIILQENAKVIPSINQALTVFWPESLRGKGVVEEVLRFVDALSKIESEQTLETFPALAPSLLQSVIKAVQEVEAQGKNKPLGDWRDEFCEKNTEGNLVLKEGKRMKKFFGLAEIYREYQKSLYKKGLFDYDDMLLETVQAIEKNEDLRRSLQEKYLYVLVDEFQDTNMVQIRLLDGLLDRELSQNRPNIMAVGDDDQAIYKFQGAKIDNMLGFQNKFRDPAVIVLTKNYRSTQDILDKVREIILLGNERLETLNPDIRKDLISANISIGSGEITETEYRSYFEELIQTGKKIRSLLDDGVPASEIAVLSKKHEFLEAFVPVCDAFKIPITYERRQNVLKQPIILELLHMLRFLDEMEAYPNASTYSTSSESLLPNILLFPFWQIPRIEVWKMAQKFERGVSWITALQESGNDIGRFFLELHLLSKEHHVERLLDYIIGTETFVAEDGWTYTSPFREYYFGESSFAKGKSAYLQFLSNVRVFIKAMRRHGGRQPLMLSEAIQFIDTRIRNNLPLTDVNTFSAGEESVQLMTAHKSKGMEFDRVFVLHCNDEVWCGRDPGERLGTPANLPVMSVRNTEDDQLRLFYVALTRAKRFLYLSWYTYDDEGKERVPLRFLLSGEKKKNEKNMIDMAEIQEGIVSLENGLPPSLLEQWFAIQKVPTFIPEERALLVSLLETYALSITHLHTFIDIINSGPHTFIEKHLLRFPQSKSVSSEFGSAMHGAMEDFYRSFGETKILPSLEVLMTHFEERLGKARLTKEERKQVLEKGIGNLKLYYESKKQEFALTDKIECSFAREGVVFGEAVLNGKIDKIIVNQETHEMLVVDLKTGKPLSTLDEKRLKTDGDKVKAMKYRQQLLFYKLLVENSKTFGGKFSVKEGIIDFLVPDEEDRIHSCTTPLIASEGEALKKLIQVVYKKIMNLDFPDVSRYPQNLKGIYGFVEDLVEERI